MRLLKQPVVKYSLEHEPISTAELDEVGRMIEQHRIAANERQKRGETGVQWNDKTIPDVEIAKKLTQFRDRQIALRN